MSAPDPIAHPFAGRVPAGVIPVVPGPGQESVWDYPRPPRAEPIDDHIGVRVGGTVNRDLARPPRPRDGRRPPSTSRRDVRMDLRAPTLHSTHCEWKGDATYCRSRSTADRRERRLGLRGARKRGRAIPGHLALYAARIDEATVDDELASRSRAASTAGGSRQDRRADQGNTGLDRLVGRAIGGPARVRGSPDRPRDRRPRRPGPAPPSRRGWPSQAPTRRLRPGATTRARTC